MTPSSLQAAIITAITQIIALVVGFGILSNGTQAVVINASVALVNVAFLVANSVHVHAAAKITAAKIAAAPAPAPLAAAK